jgi:hypothetical protein
LPFFISSETLVSIAICLKKQLILVVRTDGFVDAHVANIRITSDLNYVNEFPMTWTQNKKYFNIKLTLYAKIPH